MTHFVQSVSGGIAPDATEAEAYERTTDFVDDRYADNIGGMIDRARDQMRDAQVDRNPKGQDGATRLGAKHESAVAEGHAPTPDPLSNTHPNKGEES